MEFSYPASRVRAIQTWEVDFVLPIGAANGAQSGEIGERVEGHDKGVRMRATDGDSEGHACSDVGRLLKASHHCVAAC